MEPQSNRETSPADELIYVWLGPLVAAAYARTAHPKTERLRKGHSLLTVEQFADALAERHLEILLFSNECAALCSWSEMRYGLTCSIMTVDCNTEQADYLLPMVEAAVRERGGKAIISVGHAGWSRLVKRQGFIVKPCVFMEKVLT